MTLYYVKFRTIAPTIKSLTLQVEKRCEGHKEYGIYITLFWAKKKTIHQSIFFFYIYISILDTNRSMKIS